MSHTKPFRVGERVQLHAATDQWMQGDRYGTVVGYGRQAEYYDTETKERGMVRPVRVRLDKSRRTMRFHPDNLFSMGEYDSDVDETERAPGREPRVVRHDVDENAGARMATEISDYASAVKALDRAPRSGRIGNNTTIVEVEGRGIAIILHRTKIVTYYPDGRIVLNSGGYHTVTTKARMNEVLPPNVRVSQQRHEWYLYHNGERLPFEDGMEIMP